MKYKLLYEISPNDLSQVVTKYLCDGWELYGSPFVAVPPSNDADSHWFHYQAVIKRG